MNSLKRPGIEDGGFLSHEPEDLHAFFEEIEYVMGPLDHAAKSGLKAIFHHYHVLKLHDPQKGHLTPTKNQFGELLAICRDLEGCIQKIQKNHSAMEAIGRAEEHLFLPAGQPAFNEVVTVAQKAIDHMCAYVMKADGYLPKKKNRWPEKVVPLRDLIQSLALFYEEQTGQTAKSGIQQDRSRTGKGEDEDGEKKYKYSGPFFDLIDTAAVICLDQSYNNAILGSKIYEYLKP